VDPLRPSWGGAKLLAALHLLVGIFILMKVIGNRRKQR
jgi:hypothetical protein